MKLSILIATISERSSTYFPKLTQELMRQIGDRQDIEILGFMDNRKRTVGVKRQNLLDLAQGQYIVFFDDDDMPSEDYISSIMEVLDRGDSVDAVVFQVQYTNLASGKKLICTYDKDEKGRGERGGGTWRGRPTHIHVIRSAIAKQVKWQERPRGAQWNLDVLWSDGVTELIQTQASIEKTLYYYNYDPRISETLKRNRRIQGR